MHRFTGEELGFRSDRLSYPLTHLSTYGGDRVLRRIVSYHPKYISVIEIRVLAEGSEEFSVYEAVVRWNVVIQLGVSEDQGGSEFCKSGRRADFISDRG